MEWRRLRPGGKRVDFHRAGGAGALPVESACPACREDVAMRAWITLFLLIASPVFVFAEDKLGFDDRVEIVRGLTAEFATLKTFLPQSKKPLEFESTGKFNAKEWEEIGKQLGPA